MFRRENIAMVVAEFIGTFTLASVVLAMIGRTSFPFFAAVAAGMTLGLMTLIIGNSSGAHLNPAVSIGLWWIRQLQAVKALVFIVAQMLGGLVALTLNEYLLGDSLQSRAGDTFDAKVLVAEVVGTALFTFGVTAAISQGFQGLKRAVTVGGSLSLGIIVATFASNGLLNPAVALGVQSWSWAYAGGPVAGALVGVSLYTLLYAPRPARVVKATAKATKTTVNKVAKKAPAKKKTNRK